MTPDNTKLFFELYNNISDECLEIFNKTGLRNKITTGVAKEKLKNHLKGIFIQNIGYYQLYLENNLYSLRKVRHSLYVDPYKIMKDLIKLEDIANIHANR